MLFCGHAPTQLGSASAGVCAQRRTHSASSCAQLVRQSADSCGGCASAEGRHLPVVSPLGKRASGPRHSSWHTRLWTTPWAAQLALQPLMHAIEDAARAAAHAAMQASSKSSSTSGQRASQYSRAPSSRQVLRQPPSSADVHDAYDAPAPPAPPASSAAAARASQRVTHSPTCGSHFSAARPTAWKYEARSSSCSGAPGCVEAAGARAATAGIWYGPPRMHAAAHRSCSRITRAGQSDAQSCVHTSASPSTQPCVTRYAHSGSKDVRPASWSTKAKPSPPRPRQCISAPSGRASWLGWVTEGHRLDGFCSRKAKLVEKPSRTCCFLRYHAAPRRPACEGVRRSFFLQIESDESKR